MALYNKEIERSRQITLSQIIDLLSDDTVTNITTATTVTDNVETPEDEEIPDKDLLNLEIPDEDFLNLEIPDEYVFSNEETPYEDLLDTDTIFEDIANLEYTYHIDTSKRIITIYSVNSTETSSHFFDQSTILLTDNLALKLIDVIKHRQHE